MKLHAGWRGVLVAGAAGLLALPPAVASGQTEGNLAYQLLAGDNTEISLAWSLLAYGDDGVAAGEGPATALIGRDDLFADNLASGALQGAGPTGAPLLLTASDVLEGDVLAELMRLGVDAVAILGGSVAVSDDVEDDLVAAGFDVTRYFGATRTETAIDVAEEAYPDATQALIARSNDGDDPTQAFADSLAGGAWAAAAQIPILFTTTSQLTQSTAEYLLDSDIRQVTILGGPAAVSEDVEAELEDLGVDVDRVAGGSRFETAVAIAAARGFDGQGDSDVTLLTDGQGPNAWADGFAAAGLSARDFPLILSNSSTDGLPAAAADFFAQGNRAFAQVLDDVDLICGTTTPEPQCSEAAAADGLEVTPFPPDLPPSNATLQVEPTQRLAVEYLANPDTDPADDREYSATGLTGETYGITLVPTSAVTVDPGPAYAFAAGTDSDCPGTPVVLPGGTRSAITEINGVPLSEPTTFTQLSPVGGTITFTVDADGSESLVPVVHLAEGPCPLLPLDAEGLPTVPFGVGGVIDSRAAEALQGTYEVDVVAADKAADLIIGDPDVPGANGRPDVDQVTTESAYYYDVNDEFAVADAICGNSVPVDVEAFEAELSPGDLVITDYDPEPSVSSAFLLCDVTPAPPGLSARPVDQGTVMVAVQPLDPGLQGFGPDDRVQIERFSAGQTNGCAGGPEGEDNGPVLVVGSFVAAEDEDLQTPAVFDLSETGVAGDPGTFVDWCYRANVTVGGEDSPYSAVAAVDVDGSQAP